MVVQYLVLAIVLAATLNHGNRFVRASGTLLVAIGLAFIVLSIYLADTDGTFAALASNSFRPKLLNAQAVAALVAIVFLLWATWRQIGRVQTAPVSWGNTNATFGLVSRAAHWATATLVLCLIPIGLFMQTLPRSSPDRAMFLAVHETVGVTVLGLVMCRIAWLTRSAPPPPSSSMRRWERLLASVVHPTLYALIILLPLTGLLLAVFRDRAFDLYGWSVRLRATIVHERGALLPALHDYILPFLFYPIVGMHLLAVLKHHFISRRTEDVRRMLR